jgi:hypothetical protein
MTTHRRPRADDENADGPHVYDPLLPILAELEDHVRRSALAAEAGAVRAAPGTSTAGPARRRPGAAPARPRAGTGGRLARRAAVLAVLGCTVGATATALTLRSSTPDSAGPVVAVRGSAGAASWRLEVTRRDGRICPSVVVSGASAAGATLATDCVARPAADAVLPTSTLAPGRIVVGGLTGRRVRAVRVRVAGRMRTVATTPLAGTDDVRAFGLAVRIPRATDPVPVLRPLDGRRHALGPSVRDCSVAPQAGGCTP